jgi:hypothetical protein
MTEMKGSDYWKIGSAWAIGQGLLSALAPQLSVALTKKMLGMNFENTEELEAKPAYRRQIRAMGIGLAAAGATGLVLETMSEEDDVDTPLETS